jgi:nicotinamide-nucleotide amidase
MDRMATVLELAAHLQRRGWWLACAESCTGGGIAAALTDVAGSSAWFDRGFVTYSNLAKQEMLGVSPDTLARCGAVSRETVIEMATGALLRSRAQLGVAVSGIAGPGGGTPDKPVGTVWIAWARGAETWASRELFVGDRAQVRAAAVEAALEGLLDRAR